MYAIRSYYGDGDLLALLAARLVVVLDALRALRLEPAHVLLGVFKRVDLRPVGGLGAVDDIAGGEDARRQDLPGALHFGGAEHFGRIVGRVMHGGHAQRQGGVFHPVLLRDEALALRAMRMGVDQAGDDGLAADVEAQRIGRDLGIGPADCSDAVALDHDHPVFDHAAEVVAHGQDS